MSEEEFDMLEEGDVIRHVSTHEGFIVHGNYKKGGVLIVRSQIAFNWHEWKLVHKADYYG